jgi:hypothetical protein
MADSSEQMTWTASFDGYMVIHGSQGSCHVSCQQSGQVKLGACDLLPNWRLTHLSPSLLPSLVDMGDGVGDGVWAHGHDRFLSASGCGGSGYGANFESRTLMVC